MGAELENLPSPLPKGTRGCPRGCLQLSPQQLPLLAAAIPWRFPSSVALESCLVIVLNSVAAIATSTLNMLLKSKLNCLGNMEHPLLES